MVIVCPNHITLVWDECGMHTEKLSHLSSGRISNDWAPFLAVYMAYFASQSWIWPDHIAHIAKKERICKYLDLQSQQWQAGSSSRQHLSFWLFSFPLPNFRALVNTLGSCLSVSSSVATLVSFEINTHFGWRFLSRSKCYGFIHIKITETSETGACWDRGFVCVIKGK